MKSKDSIKKELIQIATRNGYQGEMVEIAADLLTYVLYHNQIEIMTASQESSLSTAKSINSKIRECMNVMYSVYRGKNARVKLRFKSNTIINKNKFDLLYESNTFKLYAADNVSIYPYVEGSPDQIHELECIFCSGTKYEYTTIVDNNNRYYLDLIDPEGHIIGNTSEEVKVSIDGIEYPVTRDFYEHINSPIPESETDYNNLDKIFVMTIPDYGIRIFKRGYYNADSKSVEGYFKIGSEVKIEAFKYTTLEEINTNEFNKILLPGTELVTTSGITVYDKTGRDAVEEVPREDSNSILYNANSSTRTQSKILSSSDVNHLFTEYFINEIQDSINRFNKEGSESYTDLQGEEIKFPDMDVLHIFYIPKVSGYILPQVEVENFRDKYRSYFITHDIDAYPGQLLTIDTELEIYLNNYSDIGDQLKNIFSIYETTLTRRSNYTEEDIRLNASLSWDYDYYSQLIDTKNLYALISKLDSVTYINKFNYSQIRFTQDPNSSPISSPDRIPTSHEVSYQLENGGSLLIRVPVYYEFNLIITYKNSYEIVS